MPTRLKWVCAFCVRIGKGQHVLHCKDVTATNIDTRVLATRKMQTSAKELSEFIVLQTKAIKDNATRWGVAAHGGVRHTAKTFVEFGIAFQTGTGCASTQVQTFCIKKGVPRLGSEPLSLGGPNNFPSTSKEVRKATARRVSPKRQEPSTLVTTS